jgi:hypothetical protein
MGKFVVWLGGILATVISGWLIWYFTRPPIPPPPPPPPATTTFEGMVINEAAVAPLPNAIVAVEIAGAATSGPFHDVTDEHGAYRLNFTGLDKPSGVTITVEAKGFQQARPASLTSITSDNRQDFELLPDPAVTPPPPPPPRGGVTVEHPPVNMQRPAYIQKPVASMYRLPVQSK